MKTNPNDPINPIEVGFEDGEIQQFRQISNHTAQANGLTKREYFAAIAMQGYCVGGGNSVHIVDAAIRTADLLIIELNKTL